MPGQKVRAPVITFQKKCDMTSEQEKELLEYLASLGFEGSKFEDALREKLSLNAPNFTVSHRVAFGEELMSFKLQFVKDPQFNAYRLQKYNAMHRSPVLPEHTVINGIDTAALEERMKKQDWDIYFDPAKKAANPEAAKEMAEITMLLNKLAEGQNFDGLQIQEELLYKYWPAENYTSDNKRDFKICHEHERDFSATEYGMCSVNGAYQVTSGRLDDLFEKLQAVGLDGWPGVDLYRKLEHVLDSNPQDFKLEFVRNDPEAYTEITIPVVALDYEYAIDTYDMVVTEHPATEHGTYNGIDSAELEGLMREIDWHNDRQLFIFHPDAEPDFQPKVAIVQEQIFRLSQDMAGGDIADQLMVKYWSDATFFTDMLQQSAWDYLESLPKKQQQFPAELNAKAGYNLLCGRAVAEHIMYPFRPESDQWVRLELEKKDGNGNYNVVPLTGLGKTELEDVLAVIPFSNSDYYPVRNGLLRGDLVPVTLTNEKKVLLEASPGKQTINVYTTEMRLIPTNFRLDPDWKPQQGPPQKEALHKALKPILPAKKPQEKRKGRGI